MRSALRIVAAVLLATQTGAVRLPAHRVVVERWDNGRVRRETSYRGDAMDGPSRGWYPNGAPQFVYNYADGAGEGMQRQWYPSGQIYTWFNHHAGHELGQQRMWNADGTIRSNYVIKDGRRYGLLGALGCTGKDAIL
jgi:antitoxin component YwqK of YwqJK toxin-antitoxin module